MLKPADVMEIEVYSDEEIARWDEEDRLESVERDAHLKNLRSYLHPSVSQWICTFPIQKVSEFLDSFTKSKGKKEIRRKK